MKFVGTVFVLIGCFVLGCLLFSAEGLLLQDERVERNTVLLDPNRRTAQIGRAATVILLVNAADGTIGNGSGFFVEPDLVVTSVHVLAGIHGKSYTWEMRSVNQPIQYTIKGVAASDPEYDLVLLKVEGKAPEVLQLGDSDTVQRGETVIAIGTHKSTDTDAFGKIIEGTINRITDNFFRLRATLLPGYSGGPVLNSTGKVVGISVEGGETKRSGYVIPSNRLRTLLENRSEPEKSLEAWRAEPMIRAYALANRGDAEKVFGNAKNAIAAYDAAIRLTPDFAAVYAKRGSAKYNLGDYQGTIKDYDAAIATGLDYASVYVNRGVAKRSLRRHQGAIEDYNTAIRLDPENVEAYLNRGNSRADLGEYAMAMEDYDAAIRLKPTSVMLPLAYVKRAGAQADLGDHEGAVKDYSKAISVRPNTRGILTVAYLNRGIAKFDLGDAQGAIGDYDEVIRLKPRDAVLASAYVRRADAKATLADKNGAIKDYDAAVRLVPKDTTFVAHVYGKRASVKLQRGDSKGAIEDCDAAILLDPDLAEVYKTRGDTQSNLGNHSEATQDYDRAVYIKPNYAEAYYKRGCAKIEIGNVPEAKADLRTALKLAKWESDQGLMADIEEKLHLLK